MRAVASADGARPYNELFHYVPLIEYKYFTKLKICVIEVQNNIE